MTLDEFVDFYLHTKINKNNNKKFPTFKIKLGIENKIFKAVEITYVILT